MSDKLKSAHRRVAQALAELAQDVFTPDAKLTFVMRVPGRPDCFMVIGDDDDHEELIETIRRSTTRAEVSIV